ncbi:hypothetical protein [Candidatus Vondammii sp. HM_W22]|uniref:hypothetical protein n=1 Tax=Candidatus Vondammii sp. HM_W22 TaxID=2687299 RepID=UPI001F14101C|nr:hypothetical protein [Candidatus Vondammii sp. HM_W22]
MQTATAVLNKRQLKALTKFVDGNANRFRDSRSYRRRMGVNGNRELSRYKYLKYWSMPNDLRIPLEAQIQASLWDTANEVYFLHFDKGGFLDTSKFQNDMMSALMLPLNRQGRIIIEGTAHKCTPGDGFLFALNEVHEVPKNIQGAVNYLVLLYLYGFAQKAVNAT